MSEKLRTKLVILVVIAQIIFFVAWWGWLEGKFFNRVVAQITVKTVAFDPRDLLSGQYIRLSYSFSRISPENNWSKDIRSNDYNTQREVWVILTKNKGFYEPKIASFKEPDQCQADEVIIRGYSNGWNITYGIEKYFLPEGTKEPNLNLTTVELNVYESGRVSINKVLVDGKL